MTTAREHELPAVAAPRVGVPWTLVALAVLLGAVMNAEIERARGLSTAGPTG